MKLLTALFVSIMVLCSGLTACSTERATGDDTVQMVGQSDVPLFDRAIPDDGTLETIRQSIYDAEAASLSDMTVEVTAYTTDATADEVITWYDKALAADWTKYEGKEKNGVIMARWGQGENIAFAIFYATDPNGGSANRLIMEYAWK
jgi:hypothetical protein